MTGIKPVDVGKGWITFALEPHEMYYNPLGTVLEDGPKWHPG
jgi:hypothetical protein